MPLPEGARNLLALIQDTAAGVRALRRNQVQHSPAPPNPGWWRTWAAATQLRDAGKDPDSYLASVAAGRPVVRLEGDAENFNVRIG